MAVHGASPSKAHPVVDHEERIRRPAELPEGMKGVAGWQALNQ